MQGILPMVVIVAILSIIVKMFDVIGLQFCNNMSLSPHASRTHLLGLITGTHPDSKEKHGNYHIWLTISII